jgi:hypothetical protein
MKATELRIGNYVGLNLDEFPENYFTMVEVAESSSVLTEGLEWHPLRERQYFDPADLQGIPLTNEWLEKFGFEPNGVFKSMRLALDQLYEFGTRTFLVIAHDGDAWIELIKKNKHRQYTELQGHAFKCKYVHQLQNLYFMLAGEELTMQSKTLTE